MIDIDALLSDPETRVVVCCGSGGVGKTTTAAALAIRAAEAGRKAVVLTIDPARRLAQSLGVGELDNNPRPVPAVDSKAGGSLDAMMLDMKRTFDEVVLAHTTPDKAEQIFGNPVYQAMSSSFAGTQEYMAMEKLGQLVSSERWDLVVVDTPPSRSALDFLDAPARLGRFLDGRLLRMILAPARTGGRAYLRVLGAGMNVVGTVLSKVLGAQLLNDVQVFLAAMESMFGGFRERAESTYELLKQPGTRFVVVAAPEPDALREAAYFVDRLQADSMPLAGLVLNRVHTTKLTGLSAERSRAAADTLDEDPASESVRLAAALLRVHAELEEQAVRDRRMRSRFVSGHPQVPVVEVPALPGDVHDLAGLRQMGAALAGAQG